jgi:pyrroline-5-carboxylate reductase
MGRALLQGWLKSGLGPVIVVEPAPSATLKTLARKGGVTILRSLDDLPAGRMRACIVALKPPVLKTPAAALRRLAEAGTVMISIAAGIGTKTLARAWGRHAHIVRAMPNTPGAIGRGITGVFATARASAKDRKLAETLLGALGQTVWVKREAQIDAITAVSGSGPAYVFFLVEALRAAAIGEGLPPAAAEQLSHATVAGAGALLDAENASAAQLRRNVTSPGGTTEAALQILMGSDGLSPLIARTVAAARKRARELDG